MPLREAGEVRRKVTRLQGVLGIASSGDERKFRLERQAVCQRPADLFSITHHRSHFKTSTYDAAVSGANEANTRHGFSPVKCVVCTVRVSTPYRFDCHKQKALQSTCKPGVYKTTSYTQQQECEFVQYSARPFVFGVEPICRHSRFAHRGLLLETLSLVKLRPNSVDLLGKLRSFVHLSCILLSSEFSKHGRRQDYCLFLLGVEVISASDNMGPDS